MRSFPRRRAGMEGAMFSRWAVMLAAGAAAWLACGAELRGGESRAKGGEYASLPARKEGRFPVHVPKYDGVEQLLVLSSRWVIVVTTDVEDVVRKIDELSGGELMRMVDTWEESSKAGRPNWTAYRGRSRSTRFVFHAKKNRGRGEPYTISRQERDEYSRPYLIHAKLRLYLLTGERSYLKDLPSLAGDVHPPFQWRFSHKDYSCWLYLDIVRGPASALPEDLVARWRKLYLDEADGLEALCERMPYRMTWPRHQDFWLGWGASDMTNRNRPLLAAHHLTGDRKYLSAAICNADFMLGANPMGMCWTTGLGFVYPIGFQHAHSESDGIMDPVPGITIYGITGGPIYHVFRNTVWQSPGAGGEKVDFINPANRAVPLFRRWSCHPHLNVAQCEFTVHETMAPTIYTCAMLMPEGWAPDEALKRRRPRRDELLFGYWYLP